MTHTPGPWVTHSPESRYLGEWRIAPPGSYALASCHWQTDSDGNITYNAEANARLIAAAPDLLEACLAVQNCTGEHVWECQASQAMINAAIAKATEPGTP